MTAGQGHLRAGRLLPPQLLRRPAAHLATGKLMRFPGILHHLHPHPPHPAGALLRGGDVVGPALPEGGLARGQVQVQEQVQGQVLVQVQVQVQEQEQEQEKEQS